MTKRDNYFTIVPYWVSDADISATALKLYIVLSKYADNETGESWPSRATLARELGLETRPPVDKALAELEFIGAITITPQFEGNARKSNLYKIMTNSPKGYYEAQGGIRKNTTPYIPDNSTPYIPEDTQTNNLLTNNLLTKGQQMNLLIALYYKNFQGEFPPAKGATAGVIKNLLKTIPQERLEELIPLVAQEGRVLSSGTLNFVANAQKPKTSKREQNLNDTKKKIKELKEAGL